MWNPIKIIIDAVKKPFEVAGDALDDLVHGDIGGLAIDVIRLNPWVQNLERMKDINDELEKIWPFHLYFGNLTDKPISVFAAPNVDWVISDLVSAVVMAEASGAISAPAGLEAIKNAKTMGELWEATKTLRLAAGVGGKVWGLYSHLGNVIEPTQYRDISQKSKSSPLSYLNPSQYAAWTGASDLSVIVVQKESNKMARFNCNSESTWAVANDGIIKAKFSGGGFCPENGSTWPKQPNVAWDD